jgi:predicted transposase YbfD/YdcC
LGFPGCRIGLRVDRDQLAVNGDVVSHDTRYFLTSLDPARVTAAQLLAHVRDHWQIENSHFFLKDRWWDEDRHATRRPGLADCLAILNSAAVTVLRCCHPPDKPLRARADHIAWCPTRGLQLLGLT